MKKKLSFMGIMLLLAIVLSSVSPIAVAGEVLKAEEQKTSAEIAEDIAEEGTVLLKNDYSVLPLNSTDKVLSVMGGSQVFGGGGSGWVNARNRVEYSVGLSSARRNGDIAAYKNVTSPEEKEDNNKAIYFIVRDTTEGADIEKARYYLSDTEKSDIEKLIASFGKENLIVVLNVGSVIDTSYLIEKDVGAIVLAYLGGERAGTALANVLTGKVSPSGKTVDTLAKSYDFYPSSDASGIGNFAADKNTYYTEDVYVGYRYFATFDPEYKLVNYEFGYGLSYTSFELSDTEVSLDNGTFTVKVKVTNTGDREGKEVVQVYFGAPSGKMGAPAANLAGFAKTDVIAPGESTTVTVEFSRDALSRFDDLGKIKKNAYVIEKGNYEIYVGNSVKNAVNGGSVYTHKVSSDETFEELSALRDTTLIKRLLSNGSYEVLNDTKAATNIYTVPYAGAVNIQAEDYTLRDGASTSEVYYIGEDRGYGVGNLNTNGKTLEYTLNVERAGTYNIAFNMASAWDGQANMFNLYVNGERQALSVSMNSTHTDSDSKWYSTKYLTSPSYTVTLPEGEVKLRFVGNGTNFMNFDSFVIFNNLVSGEKQTVIEAENYDTYKRGTTQIANGAATAKSNKAGSEYVYELEVETEGKYYLSLTASNVTKADDDALEIYINDSLTDAKVALMRTAVNGNVVESNYHKFIDTNAVALDLPKGTVTLKFVTKSEAVCCIDKFTLTPAALYDGGVNSEFKDNTDEFVYFANTEGEKLAELITYADVCEDPSKIDAFLSQLSIRELVRLLGVDDSQSEIATGVGGVGGASVNKKFGIPSAYAADGPAGIRYTETSKYATWFPCMTMLASTWNLSLAEEFGDAVGKECVNGGVNVWLAPGVNIHRNPLCGRNFEYFSEDPLVAGSFAAEIINSVQKYSVSVCVKHYAANNQETNRFGNNSCVSIRALREIYLKPFEIAIKKAHPYAVMSSYNMINGLHVASSYDLITSVLYGEFGFDGVVFSDWDAHMSHISLVKSGNTYKSRNPQYNDLVKAYNSGVLSREDIESEAKKSVLFLVRLGIYSNAVKVAEDETVIKRENAVSELGSTTKLKLTFSLNVKRNGNYTLESENGFEDVEIYLDGKKISSEDGVSLILEKGASTLVISETKKQAFEKIDTVKLVYADASGDDTPIGPLPADTTAPDAQTTTAPVSADTTIEPTTETDPPVTTGGQTYDENRDNSKPNGGVIAAIAACSSIAVAAVVTVLTVIIKKKNKKRPL